MRETVLITGASGGIGKEFACVFAEHGFDLVLAARTEKKLQSLADNLHKRFGVSVILFICREVMWHLWKIRIWNMQKK